ncbi:MAG: hypothetical protein V3T86_14705 [Planctomycetota bacterium]
MNRHTFALGGALLCACASQVRTQTVRSLFREECDEVEFAVPTTAEDVPASAGNTTAVMVRTVELGADRLQRHPSTSNETRTLLACAQMMRGEYEEARKTLQPLPATRNPGVGREAALLDSARFAVSACRAIVARRHLLEIFEKQTGMREFVERYGGLIGVSLPDPAMDLYESQLRDRTEKLEKACYRKRRNDPYEWERTEPTRQRLLRFLAEQVYNDAAGLLDRLPDRREADPDGAAAWLTSVAMGLMIVFSHSLDEIVPDNMRREQIQWHQQQAASVFDRALSESSRMRRRQEYDALIGALAEARVRTLKRIARS